MQLPGSHVGSAAGLEAPPPAGSTRTQLASPKPEVGDRGWAYTGGEAVVVAAAVAAS